MAGKDFAPLLTIDLGALAANYRALAWDVAPAECGAVVKADAYGLGAAEIAPALGEAGCRTFFVATYGEGVSLRAHLAMARIFVFEGPCAGDLGGFLRHRLSPVLNSLEQVDLWRGATAGVPQPAVSAALHIDTGMARLGLSAPEVAALAGAPDRLGGIPLAFVMSHLACAEDVGSDLNRRQRARFDELRLLLPPAPASLANSAGCRLGPAFHYDLVRCGIGLYGGYVPSGVSSMRSVVRAEARVVQIRQIDSPETVGYGATHTVTGPTRIATVALGYADGYKRSLSNRGKVAVGGMLVPVLGRVSMDLLTVDVTALPTGVVQQNSLVEVLGPSVPLDAVAAAADTIPHDVLTGLGHRFVRRYRRAEEQE